MRCGLRVAVMNQQTVTAAHDPCPECGGFDSAHWEASGPGFDVWHCICGHDQTIPVNEPGKGNS